MNPLHVILLSGGAGTRLWPLSSKDMPKQFLQVLAEDNSHVSMVQRTFAKVLSLVSDADVMVSTSSSQVELIKQQLGRNIDISIEPELRNTAPAILLACASLYWKNGASLDDSVVVIPIDAYADDQYYRKIHQMRDVLIQGLANVVLLGVEPTSPSEKFGYIVPRCPDGEIRQVDKFVEKPDSSLAKTLISQGALWNCGVFGFKLGYIMNLLNRYGNFKSEADVRNNYCSLPKTSFDYEVLEKENSIGVISYKGSWKDLGTWNSLTEVLQERTIGRVSIDLESCKNTNVINQLDVPVVAVGIADAVIVATKDGILVCSKEMSPLINRYITGA